MTSKNHPKPADAHLAVAETKAPAPPPDYDAKAGKKSFTALASQRAALRPTDLESGATDVGASAGAALGVARFVFQPEVYPRFARIHPQELDPRFLAQLVDACFAVMYARAEADAAGALRTDVKVPLDLVTRGAEIEARMQKICEYHFDDDPDIAPILDDLRPGTGNRDLAGDLIGYARVYGLRHDIVAADRRYVATDKEQAEQIGGKILEAITGAMSPEARKAADDLARAWTVLVTTYEEIAATGRWMFRHDPDNAARFVSLFTAGRRARKARTPKTGAAGGDTGGGAGGADDGQQSP